jgi:hypothetical protein
MKLRINKDQKLGEAVEALLASVSMTYGLQEGYNFMRHLGVFHHDIREL